MSETAGREGDCIREETPTVVCPSVSRSGRQLGRRGVVSKKHLFVQFLVDQDAVP